MPKSKNRRGPSRNDRRRAVEHQRRQMAARAVVREQSVRRARRWVAAVGGAVVLVAVVVAVVVLWPTSGAERPALTATLVRDAGELLPVTQAPAEYRIVYLVESYDTEGEVTTATQESVVRRPFDAAFRTFAADSADALVDLDIVTAFGLTADRTSGDEQASAVVPGIAIGDLRLDAALADLVGEQRLEVRERRTLLGRECQVYRSGGPLATRELLVASEAQYTDSCVDAAGLVLEELVVFDGEPVLHITARELSLEPGVADGVVAPGAAPVGPGLASLVALDGASALPDEAVTFAAAPEGWLLQGRYRFDEPVDLSAEDPAATTTTVAGTDAGVRSRWFEVWTSGPDVIVVEQGPLSAESSVDTTFATTMATDALGNAQVVATLVGSVVVARPGDDWYVHLGVTRDLEAARDLVARLVAA